MTDDGKKALGQGEGLEEETESRGGRHRGTSLDPRSRGGGVQRGEPLRAEVCRAGGLRPGSSLHPEGLPAWSSGLRPGMRLSAQQTLSLGSWAESPRLWRPLSVRRQDLGPSSMCPCQHPTLCRLRGDFM